jgi:DNA primase
VIPPSFIQDLLARTDIADVVGKYVTLKKAGINYKGLCPFHGEKSPSFIVSPSRQTYHCFGCGVHGNAVGFIMEFGGTGFVDAVKDLAQMQGMPVPDDNLLPEERERQKQVKARQLALTDVMAQATKHWKQQLKKTPRAVSYLKGRGLTGEVAAQFALGYAPDSWRGLASAFPDYNEPLLVESGLVIAHEPGEGETEGKRYDRFRDRIMFPIRTPQGEVVGFGGRVLDKGEPKYLNSPETPVFVKGRELYGLYEGRTALRNKGYAIVTEGYMDVVALAQWGFGNAVATLGTACSHEHVQKLFRFTEHIVFSFDGDAAGRRAAGRALEAALPFATDTRRLSFLFLPAEHDPDSYIREHGAEAFEACVKKAVPLSRQLIEHASADCDLDSAEGRARLLTQAIPLIAHLPEGALRGLIADELAQTARTAGEEVRRRLGDRLAERQADRPAGRPDADTPGRTDATSFGVGGGHGNAGAKAEPFWEPDSAYGTDPYADLAGHRADAAQAGRSQGRWQGKGSDKFTNPWSGKSGMSGRWQSRGRVPERRPLPRTATPLDRIVWILAAHSAAWEHLPPGMHDLLCDQAAPYGPFFRWLDRLVHDQGALPGDEVFVQMRAAAADAHTPGHADEGDDAALAELAQRIQRLHGVGQLADPVADLIQLVRPLELEALREELDLLLQSGELSEAAEARKLALFRLTRDLKLEISQGRPISES